MAKVKEFKMKSGEEYLNVRLSLPLGEKMPAAVVAHGYSGVKEEYNELAGFLCEKGMAVLQYDARGTAEDSALQGNLLCMTEWVEDAVNAVSLLAGVPEIDEDQIAFTGCSMGGANTIAMAALDPRIKRAAAMAPFADGKKMIEENWICNRGKKSYDLFYRQLLREISAREANYLVSYALGMSEEDCRAYEEERKRRPYMVSHVTASSLWNSFMMYRPERLAKEVRIPTLILHGTADEIVSREQSARIYESLRGEKRMVELMDGPHHIPESQVRYEAFEEIAQWFSYM